MRPNTLAEAIERVDAGEPQDIALAEFVDSFLSAPDAKAKFASIEREPEAHGRCAAECTRRRDGRIPCQAASA